MESSACCLMKCDRGGKERKKHGGFFFAGQTQTQPSLMRRKNIHKIQANITINLYQQRSYSLTYLLDSKMWAELQNVNSSSLSKIFKINFTPNNCDYSGTFNTDISAISVTFRNSAGRGNRGGGGGLRMTYPYDHQLL